MTERLEETIRKIVTLRRRKSHLHRQFVVGVIDISCTVLIITTIWPIIIQDHNLLPYPWWCFIACVFFSRRIGGDLSGWMAVIVGAFYAITNEPGGYDSEAMRVLSLVFVAGAQSRASLLLLPRRVKSSPEMTPSRVQLDALAHSAE